MEEKGSYKERVEPSECYFRWQRRCGRAKHWPFLVSDECFCFIALLKGSSLVQAREKRDLCFRAGPKAACFYFAAQWERYFRVINPGLCVYFFSNFSRKITKVPKRKSTLSQVTTLAETAFLCSPLRVRAQQKETGDAREAGGPARCALASVLCSWACLCDQPSHFDLI